eukprot:GHRR01029790.1.p1 GENE.GHRR01029790.1~~GHRR01029790.1.p1  ORF type:complete len:676 (+),score=286.92 GHRR01029790.1:138-2165(+)
MFAALTLVCSCHLQPAQPSDSEDSEQEGLSNAAQQPKRQPTAVPSGSGSSRKKQQAKQRQKQKQAAAAMADSSRKPHRAGSSTADNDLDKILQELTMQQASGSDTVTNNQGSQQQSSGQAARVHCSRKLPPLLGIDPKRIRGDAELRRMFGAGVVEAVDRMDGAASGRRGGSAASSRAAVRRRQLKKFMLVIPADHWPNVATGLNMTQTGTGRDGSPCFCYSWSPNYAAAQRVFEQAQASYDPNAVAAVLHQFPYHVDSLLAMNELYRSMGEAQTADDLLARALYALESAWPAGFDPTSGSVRLDIEKPENKGLFVALFRHAQALSRRGCHSSALEATKLLLALDPEDPMGALLLLDYTTLRAGAYMYLERFIAEFDSSHSLALLPNYAFSLPYARYRLEQQQQHQRSRQQQQNGQSSSGSSSSSAGSLSLLAQALLLHPLVLKELMVKLQGQGVGKDPSWQNVLGRKLFAKASNHGSESLGHLIALFVERNHQLWKAADVQAWLKTAATAAADVTDGKRHQRQGKTSTTHSQNPTASMNPDDIMVEGSADDWACVARESFPAGERNEYGHLRVADFSDNVNQLPHEELQAAVGQGGGGQDMGMAFELLQDEAAVQAQLAAARQQGAAGMSNEELRATNPLLMLLQSMLPWVNAGQQPDYAAEQQQQPSNERQGQ